MTVVIHKISVGVGEKHTLSPEQNLRRSVTAATESLGLNDNGFKTA